MIYVDSLPHTPAPQPPSGLSDSGAAMRDRALAVLAARHATFMERARRRLLTDAERKEVERLGVVIDTLQSMGVAADS